MPAPDQKHDIPQHQMRKVRELMEQITCPPTENALADEVAELRREIQALRQELAPVPGLILTGRAALDEFKRLTHGA